MTGRHADGVAESEADHFMKCPACGQWFDMRDLVKCWSTSTTRKSRSARVRPPRAKPGIEDVATGPGRREKPATMSGLMRIPDSRETSQHVRKVPIAVIPASPRSGKLAPIFRYLAPYLIGPCP
jgi:hypothetical protein